VLLGAVWCKGTQQNLFYVCFLVAILFYVGARRATERAPKMIVVHASGKHS